MRSIMRYFTKQKFEWLLADKGLYVSAAEDQNDEAEGVSDHTFLSAQIATRVKDVNSDLLVELDELMLSLQDVGRMKNFLSCWYLGTEETDDMWEEYGKEGVVFFSHDWALMSAFPDPLKHALTSYPIIYDDKLKGSALNEPLRVKHRRWHLENEFRIVFDLSRYSVLTGFEGIDVRCGDHLTHQSPHITVCMSKKGIDQAHNVIRRKGRGLVLDCALGNAISEVRVHPMATDGELADVQTRLKGYGIHCKVGHSQLRQT
ncbi:hypothetical protein [Stutzerimonas xanthomarina]|uniref:hypothetical protein n=1 Tax=Stutzerimonas xanthomarina TaxID=271420 RepID=UPI003AA82503